MSADAKHNEIEKQMKEHGKKYDFDGFASCIKKAKSEPLEMGINSEDLAFCGLKSNMSHHFIKKLEQRLNLDKMDSVRFTRGSKKLLYKIYYDFHRNFVELDFLRSTLELNEEPGKPNHRCIQCTKKQRRKENIIKGVFKNPDLEPTLDRLRCIF